MSRYRVYLHVATMGRYQEVLDEVLNALLLHRVAADAEKIIISVVGAGELHIRSLPNMEVVRTALPITAFEHPTLSALHEYSVANRDANILYLNCLGGRHTGKEWDIRAEWRKLLYFLLLESSDLIHKSLVDHDVVGVDWVPLPLPHMTSNNWWAKASYIASLPTVSDTVEAVSHLDFGRFGRSWNESFTKQRHAGEFWIGMNPEVRPMSVFKLSSVGFPLLEYGAVPWWGLSGVPWEQAARCRRGASISFSSHVVIKLQVAKAHLRALARRMRTGMLFN